jgi:micrococcal nuclease
VAAPAEHVVVPSAVAPDGRQVVGLHLPARAGVAAKAFLVEQAEGGRTVVCDLTGERSHGCRVGWCHRDGGDLAEALIRAGLARDCPRYSRGRYVAKERPEASRRLPFPA